MSLTSVLAAYGFEEGSVKIEPFGSGLINHTWIVRAHSKEYILQKLNTSVFREPEKIAFNIRLIADHLQQHHPEYHFVSPIVSCKNEDLVYHEDGGYFRLFPFVRDSHSKDVVQTPEQAHEAAVQFGRFTRLLSGLDITQLQITLPDFHNLGLRYEHFLEALQKGNKERIKQSDALIKKLLQHVDIVDEYQRIKQNKDMKLRVTHHDTKISNVLFDKNEKGICVIDLDTVMPGHFISDLGDMMRTYLSPVSEEEKDFEKIVVRDDFYKAIVRGYHEEMKDELTETEKRHFFYSGKFMIYMQAVRFLTDHINNDVYYGAKYEDHNFVRAGNQIRLLECLMEKETVLS